jgi:hypothetical protein
MFVENNLMLFVVVVVVVVDRLEEMKVEEHCKEVDQQDTELVDMVFG